MKQKRRKHKVRRGTKITALALAALMLLSRRRSRQSPEQTVSYRFYRKTEQAVVEKLKRKSKKSPLRKVRATVR